MVSERARDHGVIVTVKNGLPDADQIIGHYALLLQSGQRVDPSYLRHIDGGIFQVTEAGIDFARKREEEKYLGKGETAFGD